MNHTSTIDDATRDSTTPNDRPGGRWPLARTVLWWAHAAIRFLLAIMLLFNGVIKIGLWQFGRPDVGESLITLGEMSPMGLLSYMVGFSPLFQALAGMAELGAAVALMWRRTMVPGALVSAGSMAFIVVLNLGYDMPAKQLSLALLVMSLIVLAPWAKRIVAAVVGNGAVPASVEPRPFRSARANRITGRIAMPVGVAVLALTGALVFVAQPTQSVDDSTPAGVWAVESDVSGADASWSQLALGNTLTDGAATAQVRQDDGTLLVGTYVREGNGLVLTLKPLQSPGQSALEYAEAPAENVELVYATDSAGNLTLTGDRTMELSHSLDASVLYDRGFSWSIRVDDPFER